MSLDQTYNALADRSHREMLRHLATREMATVSELAAPLSIGLPAVLKHLQVLADAGLVQRKKVSRTVNVALAPNALSDANEWLARTEQLWSARLQQLIDLVEKEL